ncbi:hypothetical protein GGX14DRAFT_389558 [Mycena pura]|uniref:Protein-serine/threonine kinase n=1 Tax=Mycena pura TaxID=153505 RepID=A0AAD6VU51_9AGAR|nr:hypothetical protein GGX14DRAFT_389558 [Mycena pura]
MGPESLPPGFSAVAATRSTPDHDAAASTVPPDDSSVTPTTDPTTLVTSTTTCDCSAMATPCNCILGVPVTPHVSPTTSRTPVYHRVRTPNPTRQTNRRIDEPTNRRVPNAAAMAVLSDPSPNERTDECRMQPRRLYCPTQAQTNETTNPNERTDLIAADLARIPRPSLALDTPSIDSPSLSLRLRAAQELTACCCRARRCRPRGRIPPEVTAEDMNDITIKISDEGGGIPRSAIPLIRMNHDGGPGHRPGISCERLQGGHGRLGLRPPSSLASTRTTLAATSASSRWTASAPTSTYTSTASAAESPAMALTLIRVREFVRHRLPQWIVLSAYAAIPCAYSRRRFTACSAPRALQLPSTSRAFANRSWLISHGQLTPIIGSSRANKSAPCVARGGVSCFHIRARSRYARARSSQPLALASPARLNMQPHAAQQRLKEASKSVRTFFRVAWAVKWEGGGRVPLKMSRLEQCLRVYARRETSVSGKRGAEEQKHSADIWRSFDAAAAQLGW